MSSSNSPCAACKFLRRKCTQECVFAPYFPPDNPQKFANVHKVFGASNVAKLLYDLEATQREDAVQSLAYEAEFRLRDPVYGCVGLISSLQHKLQFIKRELGMARKELAGYIGPSALLPIQNREMILQFHLNNNPSAAGMLPFNMQPMAGMPLAADVPHGTSAQLTIRDPEQQQGFLEAQQQMAAAVAAREQQELIRRYEHEQQQRRQQQQQQQEEVARFNNVGYGPSEVVTATGYNQMNSSGNGMHQQPCLALGGYESSNSYHHIQQDVHHQEHQHLSQSLQLQSQLMQNQQQPQHHWHSHHLQQPQHYQQLHHLQQPQQDQQQTAKSEERFSAGGPSS